MHETRHRHIMINPCENTRTPHKHGQVKYFHDNTQRYASRTSMSVKPVEKKPTNKLWKMSSTAIPIVVKPRSPVKCTPISAHGSANMQILYIYIYIYIYLQRTHGRWYNVEQTDRAHVRSDVRSEKHADGRTHGRSNGRANERTGWRTVGRTQARSDGRTVTKDLTKARKTGPSNERSDSWMNGRQNGRGVG